jgi:Arc/MetJ family transcription regulator
MTEKPGKVFGVQGSDLNTMNKVYCVYQMKRTNLVLDEVLVQQGLQVTGLKTRRALVQHALEELVRREKQTALLSLKGKVRWSGSLAAMRRTRTA